MTTTLKPCCHIGGWPDRDAIDEDIRAARMGIRSIAAKYKVTKGMVERHRNHLGVVGGPPNGAIHRKDVEESEPPELLPGEEGHAEQGEVVAEEPGEVRETVRKTPEQDNQVTVPDLPVEIVQVEQDTTKALARARGYTDPKQLKTPSERMEYICDLVATGHWHGHKTAKRLKVIWGYADISSVMSIRREAQRALDLHRGPLQDARVETVERLRRDARMARRAGEARVAVVAEVEAAKIDGLVGNSPPAKVGDPESFAAVWRDLAEIIKDYPECLARCEEMLANIADK
jgi:hypothetical protein